MKNENESTIIYRVNNRHESVFDAFLDELELSARFFKNMVKQKSIFLNGELIKRKSKVKPGDMIKIKMDDEKPVYEPQNIPIEVLYEDSDLLIVNKPPFMLVHPTQNHTSGTMINAVACYFKNNGIKKKVRLVNRLDMNTSGVLLIAKNSFGHFKIAKQMDENKVSKKYICVVDNVVPKDEDIIDLPIGKDIQNPIKNIVTKEGKKCITKYKVLKRFENSSLLEVQILTGRTHQIRVHMAHIGHPIIGDELYNCESEYISRQALHAYELGFVQTRTNKIVNVVADYPDDIKKLIEVLEK